MSSGPFTSWQIDGEKMDTVTDFLSLGSKIPVDGDCSREIKRCLLLEIKAMTNLDSILKSRDITLLTKVCIVKAMVFSVVMYRCENWIIKKAEHWKINVFKLWCWRRLLKVSWTAWKSSQSVNPKGNQPWVFIERWSSNTLATWCEQPAHWKNPSLEETLMLGKTEGKKRRGWQRMRWLNSITDSMDMNLSRLWEIMKDKEGSLACYSPWGPKESNTTEQLSLSLSRWI